MHVLNPQTLPQYVDRLFRAAWMLCGSREDAEDLVQETFARVLLRPRMVRGTSDLAYLMKALRNEFVSGRRAASSRPEVATANDEIDSMAVDTRPDAAHVVLAHEVFETIAELPEEFRLALIAVDVVGLSYSEASTVLGCGENTVASRVHRGRERVARRFRPEGSADTGSSPVELASRYTGSLK